MIRRMVEGRAARICAVAVSVFLCTLTLLEFTALEMEWEIPVLEVVNGENSFWSIGYQREELALDDSAENVLLEEPGGSAEKDFVSGETSDGESTGNQASGQETLDGESVAGQTATDGESVAGQTAGETASDGQTAGNQTAGQETSDGESAAGQTAGETASNGAGVDGQTAGNQTADGENSGVSDAGAGGGNGENGADNTDEAQAADKTQEAEFPYYIRVNRKQNCITIYTQDENGDYTVPYKAMVCSTGLYNATPRGTFQLSTKYLWRELYGGVYGQYATRITGGVLFHSVPYYAKSKDSLCTDKYNKLGQQASMGCIRLTVEDAKWIAENCPSGTTVEIYDDDDPGPLGKPEAMKIDTDSPNKGWDPTDPDENNPWNELSEDA